ncbi:MAG: hypothetical protein MUF00_21515 [Gemmatimonadaceae bacterium]|jgi:hypothetical protein|nr:hypothetical protein [Gemmatimonadaceae bacterium]
MYRRSVVHFALLLCWACREPEQIDTKRLSGSPAERIRDVALSEARTVALERYDPFQFAEIDGARFAVLDHGGKRVLVVDSAGRQVAVLGRPGGGPGELLMPRALVRMSGSRVGVLDAGKAAIVVFDARGATSTLRLDSLLAGEQVVPVSASAQARGVVLAASRAQHGHSSEALYSAASGQVRVIAATEAVRSRPVSLPCGITLADEKPFFWPTLRWAVADGVIYVASDDAYRVLRIRAGSEPAPFIEREWPRERATPKEGLRYTSGIRARAMGKECVLSGADLLTQRGLAPFVPAISHLLVDPRGRVWVRHQAPDSALSAVDVYSSAGGLVASFSRLPLPVAFLSDALVVMLEYDADGVASLALWRVTL